MGKGYQFPLLANKRVAIALSLFVLVVHSRITIASTERKHHVPRNQGSLGLHSTSGGDRTFAGPLAPGLQVSGGSKLKRAKNKIKKAARRVRGYRVVLQHQTKFLSSEVLAPVTPLYYSADASRPIIQKVGPAFAPRPPPPAPQELAVQTSEGLPRKAILYMALLAVQFGVQPILVRRFTPQGICKSTVVLAQELVKGAIACAAFYATTRPEIRIQEVSSLSLRTWLTMAGVPAAIYTVQNIASLLAYQNLEALTFNVLNQTKILSAALCCFLVLGKKQTRVQSMSLVLLLASALVIEGVLSIKSIFSFISGNTVFALPKSMLMGRRFTHGVLPVLFASFLSGLAGALTQRNLQGISKNQNDVKSRPKNPYLFTMELTVASVLVLLTSLFVSSDGKRISQNGFFHLWTLETLIPILTNSVGGILVGLVTKHAGSVRKGFALIFGILLSGIFQAGAHGVSAAQIIGGILAATSLWLHSSNSHRTVSNS